MSSDARDVAKRFYILLLLLRKYAATISVSSCIPIFAWKVMLHCFDPKQLLWISSIWWYLFVKYILISFSPTLERERNNRITYFANAFLHYLFHSFSPKKWSYFIKPKTCWFFSPLFLVDFYTSYILLIKNEFKSWISVQDCPCN